MSRKLKCACEITAAEALADRIDAEKPPRSVLIVDTGIGWTVTMYGPQCFGRQLIDILRRMRSLWPKGISEAAMSAPSPVLRSWLQHRDIAWAKSAKASGAEVRA